MTLKDGMRWRVNLKKMRSVYIYKCIYVTLSTGRLSDYWCGGWYEKGKKERKKR